MTIARRQLVDASLTRYYHCIWRCARGRFCVEKALSIANNGLKTNWYRWRPILQFLFAALA